MAPSGIPLLGLGLIITALIAAPLDLVHGAALKATDIFTSPCASLQDPPTGGWKFWSNASTWGGTTIPGLTSTNTVGVNVTIPCGVGVILDLPTVQVGVLKIVGLFKFWDNSTLPSISLTANFILVQGKFSIGSKDKQFSQKATITLAANAARSNYLLTDAPADASNPRDLGRKGLVVAGGQVDFHGLGFGSSTPVWVKLSATALKGATSINVTQDVSAWPVGASIVITPTDYNWRQAEVFQITKVAKTPTGSTITLSGAITVMHYGAFVSDGFGGKIDQRGEVALLSRNIQIQGAVETTTTYAQEGGHFTVYFTQTNQTIEGVEFINMGQAGVEMRYPMLFLLTGSQPGTVCRKNTIRNSNQRCVVLQGVQYMRVEENVAYNNTGHCFVIEEGSEIGNNFFRNIAIQTMRATKIMPDTFLMRPPGGAVANFSTYVKMTIPRSDGNAAAYWFSNPNNSYIENIAAGCEDTGFWMELYFFVKGISENLPGMNNTGPFYAPHGAYSGNTIHSVFSFGMRNLEWGCYPRQKPYYNETNDGFWNSVYINNPPALATWFNFTVYKVSLVGLLIDTADSITIDSWSFSDIQVGFYNAENVNITGKNLRFVAASENLGTPTNCNGNTSNTCAPLSGCTLPVDPSLARTTGGVTFPFSSFGIGQDQDNHTMHGDLPEKYINCSFYGYQPKCGTHSAAMGLGMTADGKDFFDAGHSSQQARLNNSNPVWFPTQYFVAVDAKLKFAGEQYQFLVFYDKDGTLIGQNGGFFVANNTNILPPGAATSSYKPTSLKSALSENDENAENFDYFDEETDSKRFASKEPNSLLSIASTSAATKSGESFAKATAVANPCTALPASNAYACFGVCYRTVMVYYEEPGFVNTGSNFKTRPTVPPLRNIGLFSYLKVTRAEDGRSFLSEGNLNDGWMDSYYPSDSRFFFFNVVAGYTYDITIIPGTSTASFYPTVVKVGFRDGLGCGKGLTLRFLPLQNYTWIAQEVPGISVSPCAGTSLAPNTVYTKCKCGGNLLLSAITLLPNSYLIPMVATYLGKTFSCLSSNVLALTQRCSVISSGAQWQTNFSGLDLHPNPPSLGFYQPTFDASLWPMQSAIFGYYGTWFPSFVSTTLPEVSSTRSVFYFRKTFTVSKSACLDSLILEFFCDDGVVLYLNGKEIVRANMPTGAITNATLALTNPDAIVAYSNDPSSAYIKLSLPLTKSGYNASSTSSTTFNYSSYPSSAASKLSIPIAQASTVFLVEGTNYLAAELHFWQTYAWQSGFDVKVAAMASTNATCNQTTKGVEVCDGLDNDGDGLVDLDPVSKVPLSKSCSSACGVGTSSCVNGLYQACSAGGSGTETCNGKDDDCDGLIDNFPANNAQGDCAANSVCYLGKCASVLTTTASKLVWDKNATNWWVYDKGGDFPSANPKWTNGTMNFSSLYQAQAIFGYDDNVATNTFKTKINSLKGKYLTYYFAKNFTLTAADLEGVFSITFNLRRDDGAVVYVNGLEVLRANMPAGVILFNTTSSGVVSSSTSATEMNSKFLYYPCANCLPSAAKTLRVGSNWVAAEVHEGYLWDPDVAFDMDLYLNAFSPSCSKATGSSSAVCFLQATQVNDLVALNGLVKWSYSDASLPLPSSDWFKNAFVASSWPMGAAPLGNGSLWNLATDIKVGAEAGNGRLTYYFRGAFDFLDVACYGYVNASLFVNDGAVIYLNGKEVYRYQMPTGEITPTTLASSWGKWTWVNFLFSSGWLKAKANVMAVELHQSSATGSNFFFDIKLTGRKGTNC